MDNYRFYFSEGGCNLGYCTECGQELKNNPAFCEGCGAKKEVEIKHSVKRAPLSKKTKVFITIAGVLLISLISTHMILSSIYDPMKTIQSMDQAMSSNSEGEFIEYLTLDESALLNKKQYFSFIQSSGWEDIREQLASIITNDIKSDAYVKNRYGHDLFKVKRDSIAGIYDTYEIEAIPNQIMMKTNMAPATFKVGKKKVTIKDSGEPIEGSKAYPGVYTIKGEASGQYGEFALEEEIEVGSSEDHQSEYDLDFNGSTYSIYTNVPEAVLFVDGKSTNTKLEEFEYLGPFPEGKDISMFAELSTPEGQKFRSEEITQEDDVWGELPFMIAVESMEPLKDEGDEASASLDEANQFILDFRDSYEQALNSRDFSLIEPYMSEGSIADEELKEYIGELQDKDYSYEFTENQIIHTEEVGEDSFEVTTNERFVFTNHLGEKTTYDREKIYTLMKEDSHYKIEKIDINETERDSI
jgi:membrane-associated protein TcaA